MMEQLNIFDFDFTSPLISNEASLVIERESVFQFEIGTNVIFSVCQNPIVYKVISNDGKQIVVSRTDKGYHGPFHESEMTIEPNEVKAIIEGGDLIQLPLIRSASLDIEAYRNLTLNLLTEITLERKKQLDLLTYLLIVSPSSYINEHMTRLWDYLMAGDIEAAESLISYASSYIQLHDFYEISFFMQQKMIRVEFIFSKSGSVSFDVTDISEHFYKMLETIEQTPIQQLSPFELMLLYRKKGYLLTYKAGSDEWYLQHPNSNKLMYVENQTDLNNPQSLIACYEEQFTKHTFLSNYMVSELDLFEVESNLNEPAALNGFIIPSGTIVQLTSDYGFGKYIVIVDDGMNVQLSCKEEPSDIMTVPSTAIRYFYPYENKHLSVRFPRFNRPQHLTLKELIERDLKYYHGLSDKEFLDAAVYRAICRNNGTMIAKIFRALIEGDEGYAKECINKGDGGVFSTTERYESKGNLKVLEFGLRDDNRTITLNTNQIVKHLYKMLQNTKEFAFDLLTISELQIAYYVRGYQLKYDTVTDEFTLWQGIYNFDIRGHRAVLNDFNKTIQLFEEGKQQ